MRFVHQHSKLGTLASSITPLLLLAGCDATAPVQPPPPRPVVTQVIAPANGDESRTFTGVIKASSAATLGFEVPGRITQMTAKEGEAYKAGDVLAQLDVSNLEAELRSAEASADQANEELKRVQQLFESDNASRADFDSAIAAQRSAAASLDVARKKVSDGTLVMPYDGVIEDVILDEQAVVGQGTEVLSIQGDGSMEIEFGVPAEIVPMVKTSMTGKVRVGTLTEEPLEAMVSKVFPQASKSGTYPIQMKLENPPETIRGGMDGEVTVVFPNPRGDVLRVQIEAVVSSVGENPFVWIATADGESTGSVSKRLVRIGEQRDGGEIEILEGLSPGDRVVIRGVHRLSENQVVRITD